MPEKPIKYAAIPATFDETKHYIEQLEPVDMGGYMFADVVIKDLDLTEIPLETTAPMSEPYVYEKTDLEILQDNQKAVIQNLNDFMDYVFSNVPNLPQ
jgi:hypothetical protein